jgi:HEAT repeat protein
VFTKPNPTKLEEKKDVAGLVKLLKDKDHRVRAEAMGALARLRDPSSLPACIGALRDDLFQVQQGAARMLGEMKDPRAIGPLIELLEHCGDAGVRREHASLPSERLNGS